MPTVHRRSLVKLAGALPALGARPARAAEPSVVAVLEPGNKALASPAVTRGAWTWRQPSADGKWPSLPLAPVDGNAVFPARPPILRDGVLQLTGGIDL